MQNNIKKHWTPKIETIAISLLTSGIKQGFVNARIKVIDSLFVAQTFNKHLAPRWLKLNEIEYKKILHLENLNMWAVRGI